MMNFKFNRDHREECMNRGSHFMGRGPGGPWGRGGRGHGPGHAHGQGHEEARGEAVMQRILGHGDLRFVILALLSEKPSHGYELIKDIGEKSKGQYTPSPGVIYPTLTFLQEGGFASVTSAEGKNLYTITDAGKIVLDENKAVVDAIFERMAVIGDRLSRMQEWFGKDEAKGGRGHRGAPGHDLIRTAMHELKAALFAKMPIEEPEQKAIAEILGRAVEELKALRKK